MIILDTSFLYSFLNKREKYHNEAVALMNEIYLKKFGQPVIFEYVLNELLNLMTSKQPFSYVEKVIELILKDIENNTFLMVTFNDRENSLRCGWVSRKVGRTFRCVRCGFTLDRQLNASLNIFLMMCGFSPHP